MTAARCSDERRFMLILCVSRLRMSRGIFGTLVQAEASEQVARNASLEKTCCMGFGAGVGWG